MSRHQHRMVVRTQRHHHPIRGQDGDTRDQSEAGMIDGGCSYRMRVTGTLIEIKNQQRMQTIDEEGETLYSRELDSFQARRHGLRWNNYHF